VETEQGIHLIEVVERRPATARPLEEVAQTLAEALLREDRARELARARADALAARLRAGEDFGLAAATEGLSAEETPPFHPNERMVPGIGPIPGLLDAALALTAEKPASSTVFGSADAYYLIALRDRVEPEPAAVESQLAATRERLEVEARSRLQGQWYRSRREALERDGKIRFFALNPEG
jgi:parvulin-like peptidyl-prolyl isomerase